MKRYIRSETYRPITKSEFHLESRQPYGGRLQGYENIYVYDVYYGTRLLCDKAKGFTSKAKALAWLGTFLKEYNAWRRAMHEDGLMEYKSLSPVDWIEEGFYE